MFDRSRSAWILLALGLATLLVSGSVAAHASLVDAEPRANTRVDQAPQALQLRFSEPVEDTYTRVQVIGPNGTDHARSTDIHADDRHRVTVPLDDLPDGVYTVRWRTLSQADGHTRAGVYLLAVNTSLTAHVSQPRAPGVQQTGPPANASSEIAMGDPQGGVDEMLVRGAGFAGASLAAGIPLFLLVARGIELPARMRRRWSSLAIAGGTVAALAALGLVASLASRIELPFAAAMGTTPGQNLLLRAGAFAGAAGLLLAGERGRWPHHRGWLTGAGTGLALSGLLVTSLGGHAAASGIGSGLQIVVDWIHQVAVAFWVSGVAALVVAGVSRPSEQAGAELVRRFSPLAVASVVAIVATGIVSSLHRVPTLAGMADSLYGIALSAKILLLLPLLALGAYHRYWLLPELEDPGHKARDISLLRRSAGVELGLMVIVLVAAGVITTTSPPAPAEEAATPFASFDEALAADTPGPFDPMVEESELATLTEDEARQVKLTILVPNRTEGLPQGSQPVWFLLHDARDETPITDASLTLDAWMTRHGHGTSPEQDPVHVRDGFYQAATTWSMAGTWELRVNATLPSGDVLRYAPSVDVAGPGAGPVPVNVTESGGFRIATIVTPQPVTVGAQNLTVEVTPPEEGFPANAAIVVNAKPPSDPYGEGETFQPTRWREGTWSTEGTLFVEEGTWRVLVALQGKGTYEQAEFEIEVAGR